MSSRQVDFFSQIIEILIKSILQEKEITATLLCKYHCVQIPLFP